MARGPMALLSNFELASLRQLLIDPGYPVLRAHRDMFIEMKLIVREEGQISVTGLGCERLRITDAPYWPKPTAARFKQPEAREQEPAPIVPARGAGLQRRQPD